MAFHLTAAACCSRPCFHQGAKTDKPQGGGWLFPVRRSTSVEGSSTCLHWTGEGCSAFVALHKKTGEGGSSWMLLLPTKKRPGDGGSAAFLAPHSTTGEGGAQSGAAPPRFCAATSSVVASGSCQSETSVCVSLLLACTPCPLAQEEGNAAWQQCWKQQGNQHSKATSKCLLVFSFAKSKE